jgi:uncharacterized repeat protein (TIGR03803 family)
MPKSILRLRKNNQDRMQKMSAVRIFALAALSLPVLGAHAQTLTTLYAFQNNGDGTAPTASVLYEGGKLYGTNSGTAFSLNPRNGKLSDLPDGGGTDLYAGLTFNSGILYGASLRGNDLSDGVAFALDPSTNSATVLYSFRGNRRRAYTGGSSPYGTPIYHNSNVYGTVGEGGIYNGNCLSGRRARRKDVGCGLVYRIDTKTGHESAIYKFTGGADGGTPYAGLVYSHGILYGTASAEGSGYGVVYSIDLKGKTETVLHTFAGGSDGATPIGGLIYNDGYLYGTTEWGGTTNEGTVFKLDVATGSETVLYSFTGKADGQASMSALVYNGGALYGTTSANGLNTVGCCGTIFKVDPTSGAETTLYTFSGAADGGTPIAALTYHDGAFYGTTQSGGDFTQLYPCLGGAEQNIGCGTVFKFVP